MRDEIFGSRADREMHPQVIEGRDRERLRVRSAHGAHAPTQRIRAFESEVFAEPILADVTKENEFHGIGRELRRARGDAAAGDRESPYTESNPVRTRIAIDPEHPIGITPANILQDLRFPLGIEELAVESGDVAVAERIVRDEGIDRRQAHRPAGVARKAQIGGVPKYRLVAPRPCGVGAGEPQAAGAGIGELRSGFRSE